MCNKSCLFPYRRKRNSISHCVTGDAVSLRMKVQMQMQIGMQL